MRQIDFGTVADDGSVIGCSLRRLRTGHAIARRLSSFMPTTPQRQNATFVGPGRDARDPLLPS